MHQAKLLAGTRERRALDPEELDAWRAGERDLFRALGADDEVVAQLRKQALALFEAAKWKRARDVAIGLSALGSVHAVDALILARAARELSDEATAAAAGAHAERLLISIGVSLPAEPKIETLRELVERFPADSAASVKSEWESQRRLSSAIKSFECMTQHLAKGADAPARIEAALAAAGPCAATSAFPKQALKEAAKTLRGKSSRATALGPTADAFAAEVEGVLASARARVRVRAREAARFETASGAFQRLVSQAIVAPNYCVTRMGWHYPRARADYFARRYEAEIVLLSELRWDHSWTFARAELERACAAASPEVELERALIDRFFLEIGFDRRRAPGLSPSLPAIARAIEDELIIPLRALNETMLDMELSDFGGSREELRRAGDALAIAVAEGRSPIDHQKFWATKQSGDPALGFDAAGHVLLRALASQRTPDKE